MLIFLFLSRSSFTPSFTPYKLACARGTKNFAPLASFSDEYPSAKETHAMEATSERICLFIIYKGFQYLTSAVIHTEENIRLTEKIQLLALILLQECSLVLELPWKKYSGNPRFS